jgi:MFS superfamily sulfate permease-like transporter
VYSTTQNGWGFASKPVFWLFYVPLGCLFLLATLRPKYPVTVLGTVPNVAGFHNVKDWAGVKTIPGLVIYRYDSPIFFAHSENFQQRALEAIEQETTPVEWFVLNAESIIELDITAVDMLSELHRELVNRGITLALARVKNSLYGQLERSGLLDKIGSEHIYFTLPTAVMAFKEKKVKNNN